MSKIKAGMNKAKDVIKKVLPRRPPVRNFQTALKNIDAAVSMAPLNRHQHIQIQGDINFIGAELMEYEKLKKGDLNGKEQRASI